MAKDDSSQQDAEPDGPDRDDQLSRLQYDQLHVSDALLLGRVAVTTAKGVAVLRYQPG